jgi:hypothetical protein
MAFDEQGQADTFERKTEICARAYEDPDRGGRLPARGHHLRSQHLRRRDRHRGAQRLRRRFHRGDARIKAEPAARACLGRRLEPLVLVPRQRAGARGDARGVPLSRHPGRHGHGHRQRRPARGLRRHRPGTARGLRGRGAQPPREDAPSGCWSSPSATRAGGAGEAKEADLAWRELAGGEAARARAGQRHHRIHRADTEEARLESRAPLDVIEGR